MYISVDRAKMVFLYKHEKYNVICDLAWIQNQDASLWVFPIDKEGFNDFTNMEMILLMGNGHAPDFVKSWDRNRLITALCEKANALQEEDVWVYELEKQAKHIPETNGDRYQYVKGANRAVIVGKLFS